jgi:phosphate transport system ATP-binding protein
MENGQKATTNHSIRIEHLDVRIDGQHILKDINLTIPGRKITCIIGPSGCGKSTLLKSLNRMHDENPDVRLTGSIYVDGRNIYDREIDVIDVRKRMGLLAQHPCPLPMSVYDNVAYGPRIHSLASARNMNSTVEHYLVQAGLWEEVKQKLHTPATRLSLGQQQRLCLARGIATEPEYILGDEATSSLDPISTKKIEELFKSLKEKYTIILVTHILRQAKRLADNIAFMYLGEIIEAGPADEFFENPKSQLTRDYIAGSFS